MSLPPYSSVMAPGSSPTARRFLAPTGKVHGQGRTKDEARDSLRQAIALILKDRREEGLRAVPADAERETVILT
jgi:hypothetical protein